MICPTCKTKTRVMETRTLQSTVWRRRDCPSCEKRISTFELPESMVVSIGRVLTLDAALKDVAETISLTRTAIRLTGRGVGDVTEEIKQYNASKYAKRISKASEPVPSESVDSIAPQPHYPAEEWIAKQFQDAVNGVVDRDERDQEEFLEGYS